MTPAKFALTFLAAAATAAAVAVVWRERQISAFTEATHLGRERVA